VSSPTTPNETILTPTNRLKSIQIYANRVFACYHDDYILIFGITESNTYLYEDKISVKYKTDCSMPINSFLIYNQQLWISASYIIYVYRIDQENNRNSYKLIMKKHLADDHLLTMLGFSDHIWAGSLCGNVYIFRMDNYELVKMFNGHKDGVRCLCPMLDKYVISGSQQDDTSIVIWENAQASGGLNATRL
jgi:WD40 repeat protein